MTAEPGVTGLLTRELPGICSSCPAGSLLCQPYSRSWWVGNDSLISTEGEARPAPRLGKTMCVLRNLQTKIPDPVRRNLTHPSPLGSTAWFRMWIPAASGQLSLPAGRLFHCCQCSCTQEPPRGWAEAHNTWEVSQIWARILPPPPWPRSRLGPLVTQFSSVQQNDYTKGPGLG